MNGWMDTRRIAKDLRLRHWAGIMRERKESGLSIRRWCRENVIGETTFYYWQRKLREAACEQLEQQSGTSLIPATPTFAQVHLEEEQPTGGKIIIRLGAAEVEIAGNASPEVVERILRVLRESC